MRRGELVAAIRQAHAEGRATDGSPRVYRALKARGVPCCEDTVAKLMRAEGLRPKARRPFVVRTTDSRHGRPAAGDVLDRAFYPDRPDTTWAADITYVPTAEGWLYLAVVLDLFSRRVVWWAGPRPTTCGASWPAMRCGWPWSIAARGEGCCTTAIGACNTPARRTRTPWPSTGSSRA